MKINIIIVKKLQNEFKDITDVKCYTYYKKTHYAKKYFEKNSKNLLQL